MWMVRNGSTLCAVFDVDRCYMSRSCYPPPTPTPSHTPTLQPHSHPQIHTRAEGAREGGREGGGGGVGGGCDVRHVREGMECVCACVNVCVTPDTQDLFWSITSERNPPWRDTQCECSQMSSALQTQTNIPPREPLT